MYVVFDLETTINNSYNRKANPFDQDNYVVMAGWKRKDGPVVGDYFGRFCYDRPHKPTDWFTKLLAGTRLLVGHNIKFDLLYAMRERQNLDAWMAWVAGGGNVWDTQLAEYLLEGMTTDQHMLALDDVAPRYGGNSKFDEVKSLWAAGVGTEDINEDLLRRYLCGTDADHGDIGNTEIVFLGQLARARAAGQVKSILLNMGALICTTEMERNGMAVDVPLAMEQSKNLEAEIAALSEKLHTYLPKDLPFEFKWSSNRQKSALIFGGTVPYEIRVHQTDAGGNKLYAQMDEDHPVLGANGEPVRYKSGRNQGEIKTRKVKVDDLTRPKLRWETFHYTFGGFTQPKQQWATSTPGVYSVGAEVISDLGNRDIPFLQDLGALTRMTKDLTTYYISEDPDTGKRKGMLTLVQPDGIIHHGLNHTSTVTGRFSSSNPNLQNLPKGDKSDVKAVFKSRFRDGRIIQSDFTALEVYVQAILTGDEQLIADLLAGLDMHCVRVSQKEGISYEEAVRLCKVEKIPEWDAKRTKAKVFSFQRAYGAGAATISEKAGIPLEEVEALIAVEQARYPTIDTFYELLTESILQNSVPTGLYFQHPDIPGLQCNPRVGHYRTPDGKLYKWRQHAAPEYLAKRGKPVSFSPTEIKNYPVQGTGGEWMKAAMWLLVREFYRRNNFNGKALLVNTVHDAAYVDASSDVALEAAKVLQACMQEASDFMGKYFNWAIPCPVPTETTWGPSMAVEDPLPDGWLTDNSFYREMIERLF